MVHAAGTQRNKPRVKKDTCNNNTIISMCPLPQRTISIPLKSGQPTNTHRPKLVAKLKPSKSSKVSVYNFK